MRFWRDISVAKIPSEKQNSPAKSTRAGKRRPHNTRMGKLAKILSPRKRHESIRDTGTLLMGQNKISLTITAPGLQWNKAEWTRVA